MAESNELTCARAIASQYSAALTQVRITRAWAGRLGAYRELWDVLERAELVRAALAPIRDSRVQDSLDTLFEYWSEIKHLPEAERMEREVPEAPSLERRGIEAYRHTVERINR